MWLICLFWGHVTDCVMDDSEHGIYCMRCWRSLTQEDLA